MRCGSEPYLGLDSYDRRILCDLNDGPSLELQKADREPCSQRMTRFCLNSLDQSLAPRDWMNGAAKKTSPSPARPKRKPLRCLTLICIPSFAIRIAEVTHST